MQQMAKPIWKDLTDALSFSIISDMNRISMRQLSFFWILLIASCGSVGCSLKDPILDLFEEKKPEIKVVQVGSVTYAKTDLEQFFDSRLSEFRDSSGTDKIKSNLLEVFIEEKLLLYQADQLNMNPNPEAVKAIISKIAETDTERQSDDFKQADAELEKSIVESLKMQQYVNNYLLGNLSVSDEECEAYYNEHLSSYWKKDVVRVREILVDNLPLAEKIVNLLKEKSNKNFGDLARVYSKGTSATEGGDLGRFQRGDLPEEFEKVIFRLSPGLVSKIVPSRYGYHIFLLDEKIPAHQQKFVAVEDSIREKLLLERKREMINKELESLRKQVPVIIYRESLGFNYIGTQYATGEGSKQ